MPASITIEEATERIIDYRGKTPPKTGAGVRLITAKVIKSGRILDEPKEFIAADYYDAWMRRGLPKRLDVLITTEAPLGEVAILRDSEKIALAQRVVLLRARPATIDPVFLFYALQSAFAQGELVARATGTTVAGIKQRELRQVRVPVFPLPLQRRIASILSGYDDLIENNLRRIKILEEMARAIYREWFVEFRFPEHESFLRVASPIGGVPKSSKMATRSSLASRPALKMARPASSSSYPTRKLSRAARPNSSFYAREVSRRSSCICSPAATSFVASQSRA